MCQQIKDNLGRVPRMHETVRCLYFLLGWHVCADIVLCESSQCHSVIFKDTAGPIAPTSSSITLYHGLASPTKSVCVMPPSMNGQSHLHVFFSAVTPLREACMFQICCHMCLVAQLCPAVCGPMDHSPPGSSAHGIFQARILGWGAISSSRTSSQLRD